MAKEFNIHTYPTFFLLLLIMLIPFALSVGDITQVQHRTAIPSAGVA